MQHVVASDGRTDASPRLAQARNEHGIGAKRQVGARSQGTQ
jgi:hypothetical protein